ncbi:MAG: M23 family metallopeptidase [Duncaniella sp.]|nr:M23 family metallopeptidase [Duncaniella sp.]
MKRLISFFMIIVAGASAIAGALAQHRPTVQKDTIRTVDLFSDLVRLVGSSEQKSQAAALRDTVSVTLNVLDYLSTVYEENDYYNSEYKGGGDVSRSDAGFYVGPLPEYMSREFVVPIHGIITSRFGLRNVGKRMHKGVDISLHRGDSIKAALGGKVERVGYERRGYGHFVIVAHRDGVQTRYAHLQCPLVRPGDEVMAGDIIALGGTSGNSTGPHLHFEIRCMKLPVDPTPLITAGTERAGKLISKGE